MSVKDNITTYKGAGVDIKAADVFVNHITKEARRTNIDGVVADIGGFGALFNLSNSMKDIKEPVLVSSTDGVGTKLILAQQYNKHDTIGIDLVAMCVNDILVQGATPLFFMDYIAIGKIDPRLLKEIISGIISGCIEAEVALIGGETAEMPDMYNNKYDLAGFAVGIVDRSKIKPQIQDMQVGDLLIGLTSTGFHSNGYSLLRKLPIDHDKLSDILLKPTKIYTKVIKAAMAHIKGMAHITGGGIPGNIKRVIPNHLCAEINLSQLKSHHQFQMLAECGVEADEILNTFNVGIGMILIISKDNLSNVVNILHNLDEQYTLLGQLIDRKNDSVSII